MLGALSRLILSPPPANKPAALRDAGFGFAALCCCAGMRLLLARVRLCDL